MYKHITKFSCKAQTLHNVMFIFCGYLINYLDATPDKSRDKCSVYI